MYIYYHFQQNISKNHVTFRFSNLPSPPGPCDLTGQKGGGPKSLQTKFDTPSSEDMSDNQITNFNKKPLSDNLIWVCLSNISMADLQSKSGADALEQKTYIYIVTYILVVYGPLIEFSARRCYPSVL